MSIGRAVGAGAEGGGFEAFVTSSAKRSLNRPGSDGSLQPTQGDSEDLAVHGEVVADDVEMPGGLEVGEGFLDAALS